MATEPPGREHGRQLARLNAFSDGLFTIAATLLVLSIDIPNGSDAALQAQLDDLIAPTLTYFLSFAVIGLFWVRHHQLFGRLSASDQRFAVLNLIFLAFVALLPAPTQLLGRYGGETGPLVIYAANVLVLAVLLRVLHADARERGLLDHDPWDRQAQLRSNAVIGAFAASIPLAFVAPQVAPLVWLLPFVIPRLMARG